MIKKVRNELLKYQDIEYAKFNSKLCPNTKKEIIGIRIPTLRKLAKDFAKNEDRKSYLEEALNDFEDKYFEEVIIQGFILGYAKMELKDKLFYVKKFIPKIDSWAISDTFIPTFKFKANDLFYVWKFILPYIKSNKEFEVRFAVIMMLDYFINDEYVDRVIEEIDKINCSEYYAQMAIAWTLAEIGIKYQNKAITYLKSENNLDKFTYNKSLQKMIESYRIDNETKNMLRKMKKHA